MDRLSRQSVQTDNGTTTNQEMVSCFLLCIKIISKKRENGARTHTHAHTLIERKT